MTSTPKLYRYVKSDEWPESIDRASSHPQEAEYVDEYGFAPLHRACFSDLPPIEVVNALINAYPGATSLKNVYGQTPLHLAVIGSSPEVVKRLLESNMLALRVRNNNHRTPLAELCAYHKYEMNAAIRRTIPSYRTTFSCTTNDGVYSRENYEPMVLWRKNACLLVKADHHNSVLDPLPDGKKFRMVHACVAMQGCPYNLMQFALKCHPEQLQESDEEGNLAFQLAIRSGKIWKHGVETILEGYPAVIVSIGLDERFYPIVLSFLGRKSSLSVLFGVLREIPCIIEPFDDETNKRKRADTIVKIGLV